MLLCKADIFISSYYNQISYDIINKIKDNNIITLLDTHDICSLNFKYNQIVKDILNSNDIYKIININENFIINDNTFKLEINYMNHFDGVIFICQKEYELCYNFLKNKRKYLINNILNIDVENNDIYNIKEDSDYTYDCIFCLNNINVLCVKIIQELFKTYKIKLILL